MQQTDTQKHVKFITPLFVSGIKINYIMDNLKSDIIDDAKYNILSPTVRPMLT